MEPNDTQPSVTPDAAPDATPDAAAATEPAAEAPRRRVGLWITVGALVLLLIGGGAGAWWYIQDNRVVTPPAGQLTMQARTEIFLTFWQLAKSEYTGFEDKRINWDSVRTSYLKQLHKAPDDTAFNLLLYRAVAELKDSHSSPRIPNFTLTGAGLGLSMDGDRVVIRAVAKGSEAATAGFVPGMEITSVDGQPTATAWAAANQLRGASHLYRARWAGAAVLLHGPVDTTVQVTAKGPSGQPVTATLKRVVIPSEPELYSYKVLDGGIIYMKVTSFSDGMVLLKSVKGFSDLVAANPPGFILDLRGNPGGQPEDAVTVMNSLSSKPLIFGYIKGRTSGIGGAIMTEPKPKTYEGPVLLLTDPGCASTCDLLTTALQRNNRAKLVGEPPAGATFSAGDRPVGYGYVIHLSGGNDYMGPDKLPIEGHPAKVEYPVAPTAADWASGRDPVLEQALSLLKK